LYRLLDCAQVVDVATCPILRQLLRLLLLLLLPCLLLPCLQLCGSALDVMKGLFRFFQFSLTSLVSLLLVVVQSASEFQFLTRTGQFVRHLLGVR
jgi:hypothetical protein